MSKMHMHTNTLECGFCFEQLKHKSDTTLSHKSLDHGLSIYPDGTMIYSFKLSEYKHFCVQSKFKQNVHSYWTTTKTDIFWKHSFVRAVNEINVNWSIIQWAEFAKNSELLK